MTTPLFDVQPAASPRAAQRDTAAPSLPLATARSVCGAALLLGLAGDALLRDGPNGIAFGVWIAVVVLNLVSLVWRSGRSLPKEAVAWLAVGVIFSLGLAWRNSEELAVYDFLATVACLGMASIALGEPRGGLFAARLRDTALAWVSVAVGVIAGLIPLALREIVAPGDTKRLSGRGKPAIRAALISAALLIVFGSLLRGADPIFASLVTLPALDFEELFSHVVLMGFFTWIVAGWARSALVTDRPERRLSTLPGLRLGMLDVTTALGTLTVLFAAFVLTQLGWFFGGEAFLRDRTGLTAATYARQGFFQMVAVVALVVPVLVGTRAALAPGHELARRHTMLSLPVIGLLGAIIVSAVLRMKMYVHFYGLTTDRFYPLVFMGWLAVVLVWLALTVLRDWGRPFVAGAAISGFGILAVLNVIDPDAIVARVNVDRTTTIAGAARPTLDVLHLSRLSGGATEIAVRAVLAPRVPVGGSFLADDDLQHCDAATRLLDRWGPASAARIQNGSDGGWRLWNADESAALRVVSQNSAKLRAVMHATCKAPSRSR